MLGNVSEGWRVMGYASDGLDRFKDPDGAGVEAALQEISRWMSRASEALARKSLDRVFREARLDAVPGFFSRASYVMKYPVTQGPYVDSLNTLSQAQATARKHTASDRRYAISGSSVGSYATSLPFVAMNYMPWADGVAFADWAGLRPMTELEYEKVARGPLAPVANEFAWGSTSITQAMALANAGTITETPTPAGANAVYGSASGVQGPVRGDSFAVPWPGSNAGGAGFRGGVWSVDDVVLRVSYRSNAASTGANRYIYTYGWRGARSAP